jgi:hypothetical protein
LGSGSQLSVRLVGVGDGLGLDIAGGSPAGDLLPVSPGEHPLDGEHLGGLQPRSDAWAEGARQRLFVVEHVLREASRQARRAEHQPVKRHHPGMIVKAGDGVVAVKTSQEMAVQRGNRPQAGLTVTSERLSAVLEAIKETGGGMDAVASPELTQLMLRYPWSRLSRRATSRSAGPQPGDRAPDAPLRETVTGSLLRLFDLFRGPHFTLLGLGERSAAALGHVETDLVKPCLVGPGGLLDDGGHVARAYGTDALILVRPDGYIGLIAEPEETGEVAGYLRSL